LLLQGEASCNVCISVSARRFARAASPAALVDEILIGAPLLAERIAGDLPLRWSAVAAQPSGWSASDTRSGLFRLGDQGAVAPSLAGDGLAFALTSGLAAAGALLDKGTAAAPQWQRRFSRRARLPLTAGELLRRAAAASFPRSALMAIARHAPPFGALAAASTRIGSI
jgi:flavin-dependent dehydrogenase